jgi:hypothetical protein
MGQKLGSNRCPLFTMLTKQKFLNVLHSKLVKKTKGLPGLLSDLLSQGLRFSKESGLINLGDLPILKKSGLFSRATCPHTHCGLFSRATCPHIHTLVYFHGRPAHTYSRWSVFKGDLPTQTHTGLFSRATCPFDWVNLRSHLAISFNQNQNWCEARSIGNPIWRFHLTKAKLCVWLD